MSLGFGLVQHSMISLTIKDETGFLYTYVLSLVSFGGVGRRALIESIHFPISNIMDRFGGCSQ